MAGTFTYTYDPTNVPRDAVRLELQDTDEDSVLLWDEEIDYYLEQSDGNTIKAAILGAGSIMAKFARSSTREQSGKYQVYWTDKIGDYKAIITLLEEKLLASSDSGIEIHYGGIDIDTVDSVRKDDSRVHNLFHTDRLKSEYLESPERM